MSTLQILHDYPDCVVQFIFDGVPDFHLKQTFNEYEHAQKSKIKNQNQTKRHFSRRPTSRLPIDAWATYEEVGTDPGREGPEVEQMWNGGRTETKMGGSPSDQV